jgi:hypothetical protein
VTSPNLASSQNVLPMTPVVRRLLAGENTIYTVPVGKAARLDKLVLTNVSTYEAKVSVSLLNPGVVPSDSTRVGPTNFPIEPGDALTVDEILGWVPTGVAVSVSTTLGDAVVAKLTGLEFA